MGTRGSPRCPVPRPAPKSPSTAVAHAPKKVRDDPAMTKQKPCEEDLGDDPPTPSGDPSMTHHGPRRRETQRWPSGALLAASARRWVDDTGLLRRQTADEGAIFEEDQKDGRTKGEGGRRRVRSPACCRCLRCCPVLRRGFAARAVGRHRALKASDTPWHKDMSDRRPSRAVLGHVGIRGAA